MSHAGMGLGRWGQEEPEMSRDWACLQDMLQVAPFTVVDI